MSFNKFKDTTVYGNFVIDKKNVADPMPTFDCKAPASFYSTVTGLSKSTVGLTDVDNTTDLNKPISTATQSALDEKADDNVVVKLFGDQTITGNKIFSGTTSGISKSMVGLENVDNTSDLLKPISTATQNALNLKADNSSTLSLLTILKAVYPIGTIYTNASNTNNPNTIFGVTIGTWQQITGRFLRSNTSGGDVGGFVDHQHRWYRYNSGADSNTIDTNFSTNGGTTWKIDGSITGIPKNAALQTSFYTEPIEHLPPYVDVLMWKRTA